MGKVKDAFFSVSKGEFEKDIWQELEKELRQEMEEQAAPPGGGGGPAGGLSMTFDSLTAVCVVEVILPTYFGKAPPAEKIIREGGYESVDDFISDIKPKLLTLCPELKDERGGKKKKIKITE